MPWLGSGYLLKPARSISRSMFLSLSLYLSLSISVFVSIYLYVYTYMYTFLNMCTYVHVYTYIYTHIHTYVCLIDYPFELNQRFIYSLVTVGMLSSRKDVSIYIYMCDGCKWLTCATVFVILDSRSIGRMEIGSLLGFYFRALLKSFLCTAAASKLTRTMVPGEP